MDNINLLSAATASDQDTYSNLSGMVVSLMSELAIVNKKIMVALK